MSTTWFVEITAKQLLPGLLTAQEEGWATNSPTQPRVELYSYPDGQLHFLPAVLLRAGGNLSSQVAMAAALCMHGNAMQASMSAVAPVAMAADGSKQGTADCVSTV